MIRFNQFDDFLSREDYHGRILHGPFSRPLKDRLLACLKHFHSLDRLGSPIIPYIAAWQDGVPGLWHEFTGRRLLNLLGCEPMSAAACLRDSLVVSCVYREAEPQGRVIKEVTPRQALRLSQRELREQVRRNGALEAIYQLVAAEARTIWLKDQATVEVFPDDGICLSLGSLICVSNEMRAEEALLNDHSTLRQHRVETDRRLKDTESELRHAQREIIARLAKATEFRDQTTGAHITKMSHYCATIGQAIGVKPELNELLFHAAPMHDVGKIGIADSILKKPGRLTPEEFKAMQMHTHIGAELLSGHQSQLLKVAKHIALTHHERWDGTGYPRGLKQREIPLPGRIAALCDVFDALTSPRPYKEAWPFERAVREIWCGKGRHFDPRLVDAFMKHLPAIRQIFNRQMPLST